MTLTEPRGEPWIVSGSRRVLRPPNWELANQPLYSAVRSSVKVEPEAVHPDTEPQLNCTAGTVLNCRLTSVMDRGVEDEVMRTANPPWVVVSTFCTTGGAGGIERLMDPAGDVNDLCTESTLKVPAKDMDPATVPV